MDGIKDVLGMWVGENESAKFWLSIMNGLRNRGLEDILIRSAIPLGSSYKDIKLLMADLKKVYAAIDEQTALYELDNFEEKWGSKYPKIAVSWRTNWVNLSTYFKYPEEVRKPIYTTNAIEGFNRQLRKVTKSKSVFPTDDSLLKCCTWP